MKKFNKNLIVTVLSFVLVLGFTPLTTVHAATLPPLGSAASFSVLANTAITNSPTSSISGNVGLNNAGTNYAGLTTGEVLGTIYDTNGTGPGGAPAILSSSIQTDAVNANADMLAQGSPTIIGTALDGLTLVPGVYDLGAAQLNGGILHLNGAGIYIFRASSSLTSSGSIDFQNGARACDLFWSVNSLATINGSSFAGTIIAGTGIHFGANVTLNGRALAVGGDVTMISDVISGPTCAQPVVSNPTPTPNSTSVSTNSGGGYISQVAPIIDIVKIPSPLALPSGPGSVIYTYTVSNIGTVPMYNVTVVDDSCSPMKFISGNTNADSWLDLNEKWTYQCTSTLSATHTNSVVATGWANGRIATDIATATVVVGANVTPPLIHVTKVPSPLALLAGPGIVTYTEKVTNPGVAALSNIVITDDKCSPLNYISGDLNNDSKLDTTETWTYTCQTNLSTTTTNTARVQGTVNGFIAKDFAIVTVVVSTPGLPKTGFPPRGENMMWYVIVSAGILVSLFSFYLVKNKKTI